MRVQRVNNYLKIIKFYVANALKLFNQLVLQQMQWVKQF